MRLAIAALASAAVLVAATQPIVIQNATILTVTKGTLTGSILIRDGKIAEVKELKQVEEGQIDLRQYGT